MLFLTRRRGQSIIINDNIKITMIKTLGNNITIGIDAPKEYSIAREEIYHPGYNEYKETNNA